MDLNMCGPQVGEAFAPFDDHQAFAIQKLVDAQRGDLARFFQAIEIDVVEPGWIAVFVNQGKGGAGDVVGWGGVEAFGDAFDEGGFAGAEVADEQNQAMRGKLQCQAASEGDGFFGGMGLKRLHLYALENGLGQIVQQIGGDEGFFAEGLRAQVSGAAVEPDGGEDGLIELSGELGGETCDEAGEDVA